MANHSRSPVILFISAATFAAAMGLAGAPSANAASQLRLAPGLSFNDDFSPNFPIQGRELSDASVPVGKATVIFFGTSNCWNTAREAERLVKLYPQFRERLHFVVIDLNHLGPGQDRLVARYYHGYVPTIAVTDSRGAVIYDHAGETSTRRGDTSSLQRLLDAAR